jgi:hypothetical protein
MTALGGPNRRPEPSRLEVQGERPLAPQARWQRSQSTKRHADWASGSSSRSIGKQEPPRQGDGTGSSRKSQRSRSDCCCRPPAASPPERPAAGAAPPEFPGSTEGRRWSDPRTGRQTPRPPSRGCSFRSTPRGERREEVPPCAKDRKIHRFQIADEVERRRPATRTSKIDPAEPPATHDASRMLSPGTRNAGFLEREADRKRPWTDRLLAALGNPVQRVVGLRMEQGSPLRGADTLGEQFVHEQLAAIAHRQLDAQAIGRD